jgi:hypothetical protein
MLEPVHDPPSSDDVDGTATAASAAKASVRYHLSASRVCAWLGVDATFNGSRSKGSASQRLELCRSWNQLKSQPPAQPPVQPPGQPPSQPPRKARSNNPRIEHGLKREKVALTDFADFSGIESIEGSVQLIEHPQYNWIAAVPDALLGSNAILEIKAPWSGKLNGDANIHLGTGTLLQVHTQLECTDREFAIVIYHCEEYFHVWKVLRDRAEFHPLDSATVWDVCFPEYQKYEHMVARGCAPERNYDAITYECQERIRLKLHEYRTSAVFKLVCPKQPTTVVKWALAAHEKATNPDTFTLIDRVLSARLLIQDGPFLPLAQRFLHVWWLDKSAGRFWDPNETKDVVVERPSRGFVRGAFHSHVVDPAHFAHGNAAWGIADGSSPSTT